MPLGLRVRNVHATALRRLAVGRVLIVNGPRQAGKTSLLQLLHEQLGGSYASLDETRWLRVARTDPGGFVAEAARPSFIDEAQRAGDPLLLAVKAAADRENRPGAFVLAGSTRFLYEPRLSESLAGRALFIDLWPFSQSEIAGAQPENFISRLFAGPAQLLALAPEVESRAATFERVVRGGMPGAVWLPGRDRNEFLSAYIRTIAARDIVELGRLPTAVDLPTVMRVVAARTAQELNVAALASTLGISADVLRRLLTMLESVYFHYRLPAWSRNLTRKAIRKPKLHLVDSGVAARLCGADVGRLRVPGEPLAGALLETFVAGEVMRQLTWSDIEAFPFHWRDREGAEVDLVLERPSGELAGIEIKAALDFDVADTRGLRSLRDRLGDRFAAGVLLHCGDRVHPIGDRLVALPISALWAP